ncbi:MAG: hypothetical protein LBT43_02200 [Prevotella sp.]|jgi:hypothetical protein|nr:hypothetical protein [Prevotella sp.]
MTKENKPTNGRCYTITLFFNPDPLAAVFYQRYTDLFGNRYNNLFMDDSGRIYEMASVQKWE